MATVLGSFIAIKFVQLYTKPFKDWPAYKMGLIDEKGAKIRDAETSDEEKEFVSWKNLIRKLKIILNKVPLGEFGRRLASFASAFWLLREEFNDKGYKGEEIINNLFDHIKSVHNLTLNENLSDEFILPGKYSIKDTCNLIIIKENLKPIGNVFGFNVYKVKDIISSEYCIITSEDLVSL